jgi:hypothetical protein
LRLQTARRTPGSAGENGTRHLAGVVGLISGAVNLAAIAAMGLLLAPATPAGGEVAARAAYIAGHRPAVVAGWLLWIAASLALLANFAVLRSLLSPYRNSDSGYRGRLPLSAIRYPLSDFLLRYALAVATVGAALDIGADLLMLAVLPSLAAALQAAPGDPTVALLFRTFDEAAVGWTGGVANSLYAVAGGLVTAVLFRAPVPRLLAWLGVATWGVAALATLALAFAPVALPAAVALSIFLYVAWAWAIAAWCQFGVPSSEFGVRGSGHRGSNPLFGV